MVEALSVGVGISHAVGARVETTSLYYTEPALSAHGTLQATATLRQRRCGSSWAAAMSGGQR